jgi:hypothetical protein
MKGVLLSLAVFAVYVLVTAVLAHWLKPRRYSRLFQPAFILFALIYTAAYWLTPPDLGILPAAWRAQPGWLDALGGFLILALNYFSYIDWFFGFNGGFSMSLLLEMLRAGARGLTTAELIGRYTRGAAQSDKIFDWRVPRLVETGYLVLDGKTGVYQLTGKGRLVARLTYISKRVLNLGAGG